METLPAHARVLSIETLSSRHGSSAGRSLPIPRHARSLAGLAANVCCPTRLAGRSWGRGGGGLAYRVEHGPAVGAESGKGCP
jgi:hypothetical protein